MSAGTIILIVYGILFVLILLFNYGAHKNKSKAKS